MLGLCYSEEGCSGLRYLGHGDDHINDLGVCMYHSSMGKD
jgi:hypothetical protein